jgi:hypothetical protein
MKETKKQRKLRKGMNSAAAHEFNKGHSAPIYANISKPNQPELFAKVKKVVPYVNPNNFGA